MALRTTRGTCPVCEREDVTLYENRHAWSEGNEWYCGKCMRTADFRGRRALPPNPRAGR